MLISVVSSSPIHMEEVFPGGSGLSVRRSRRWIEQDAHPFGPCKNIPHASGQCCNFGLSLISGLLRCSDCRVPSISGLFKWRQFEPEVILLAVGWYLRFSLSYRDVEELLAERGLHADHVTVWRSRPALRPGNGTTCALETQTNQRQLAG